METEDLQVGSGVDSGGGDCSSVTSPESEITEVESQFSLGGEELFSTDVSDTQSGWVSESDSQGFSTDVSDTRRKQRRAAVQGAPS